MKSTNMKRFLAALLAVLMICSLTACGQAAAPAAATEAPAAEAAKEEAPAEAAPAANLVDGIDVTEHVNLTIAARGGSYVDQIELVKGDFEQKFNCTVEVLGLEADQLKANVALDSTNKEGAYDLLFCDDPWVPEWADAGIFADLGEMGYTADPDFIGRCIDVCTRNEKLYALPFSGNVMLFFYNKDVYTELGMEVPTTWEGVLANAKTAHDAGKVGFVIRGQQSSPIVCDWLPLLWSFGGDIVDKDFNVVLNSPEAVAALQMYIDLFNLGANYEKNDIIAAVSEGAAAQSHGWPSWYVTGNDTPGQYAPIPSKVNDEATSYCNGVLGNWMCGVAANSTHKELALELLKFITSADAQTAGITLGSVPTRTSVLSNEELVAQYPYFLTLLDAMNNGAIRPRTPKWNDMEAALAVELSAAVSGLKTAEQAIADAQTALEAILG